MISNDTKKKITEVTGGTNPVVKAFEGAYDYLFGGNNQGGFDKAVSQLGQQSQQTSSENTGGGDPHVSTKIPANNEGLSPEEYVDKPGAELPPGAGGPEDPEQGPLAPSITDKEYESLVGEANKGNKLADAILKEYHPKYGDTAAQFEQSLTQPFVKQLDSLSGELAPLEAGQEALQTAPGVGQAAANAISTTYSGKPVVGPDATTQALTNEFAADTAAAQADLKPEEQGLADLGKAAKLSEKTFPYQSLVEDLLNRYAYQVESPSYQPTATNYPGLPDWLKTLFTGSTGVELGGGSTTSNVGVPDLTGVSVPSLSTNTPASTASG